MELENLQLNQWYYTPENDYYFIARSKNVVNDLVQADYITQFRTFVEDRRITNSSFWWDKKLRLASIDEIREWLPANYTKTYDIWN